MLIRALAILFVLFAFAIAVAAKYNPENATLIWTVVAVSITATTAILGALLTLSANFITNRTKISEFRQAWIIALRTDMAEYFSLCRKWMRVWETHNETVKDMHAENDTQVREQLREQARELRIKLDSIYDDAFKFRVRIRLHINPRSNNPTALRDAEFLKSLDFLLNPMSAGPPHIGRGHIKSIDETTELARELLKREWQVAKGLMID